MTTFGARYEETKGLRHTEIAKLIRQDIKASVKAGELPAAKYSVRCPHWGAIRIDIKGRVSFAATTLTTAPLHGYWRLVSSPEMASTLRTLTGIADAYNYDHSRIEEDYFNVRYYSSVSDCTDNREEEYKAANASGILGRSTGAVVEDCSLSEAIAFEMADLNRRHEAEKNAATREQLGMQAMDLERKLMALEASPALLSAA